MKTSKMLLQYIEEFDNNELEIIEEILTHKTTVPKAPTLLKESIIEMNEVLLRAEKKNGNSENLKQYRKWLQSMELAFTFIMDVSSILKENVQIKDMSDLNYRLMKQYQAKLAVYEALEYEIISGKLEQDLEIVRKKIATNGK